ncbi:hypothetical protein [Phenylobacterium sp.]|jgi:hypothetical protein|uniref:hypothetical protein n=1 Tax=Phenylobacterium sp. TaxID=1871053 RepID=UPI002F3E90BB
MYPSLKPSQRAAIVAVISPQSASSVQSSGWVDASKFQHLLATIVVGALGASATVDAKLQQATDSSGTAAKDITGKSITQLLKSTPDDNKQAVINLRQEELDIANNFNYVKLMITPAVAASLIYGQLEGFDPRYGPADGYAATTVAQVVA